MHKKILLSLSLAFAMAIVALPGSALAADAAQDAYNAYNQAIAPIREQLASKHAELGAMRDSEQRDDAKAKQLFKEIGELKGQLYVAQEDLRAKLREAGVPEGGYGMHHRGGTGYGYGCGPDSPRISEQDGYPMHRGSMGYGGGHMRRGGHMGGGYGGHRGGGDW